VNSSGVEITKEFPMSKSYDLLGDLANALRKNDWKTMHASGVADVLNSNGLKNTRGKEYKEKGRGIFKFISSAYAYIMKKGDKDTATNIACSFPNDKNEFPWKKTK
jgi:hypothetical protein